MLHIAEIKVTAVGEIAQIAEELIAIGGPMQLHIEGGVRAVGQERAGLDEFGRIGAVHLHVVAVAVLHPQHPRGAQLGENAVVEGGDELVAEILERIVRLEERPIVLAILPQAGKVEPEAAQRLCVAEQAGEVGRSCDVHPIIVQSEVGGVELVLGVIHHPVEHIGAAVVESGGFDRDATRSMVGGAESEGAVLLGAKLGVAFLRGVLIIEVGEGGQAERSVPRGGESPSGVGTPGHVDAGIETQLLVDARIALRHESERHGPVVEKEIVFHKVAHICAFGAFGVVGNAAVVVAPHAFCVAAVSLFATDGNPVGGVEVASQIARVNELLSHFRAKSGAACCPIGPRVEAEVEDIAAIKVLVGGRVAHKLEVVGIAQPRHLGGKVQAAFGFGAHTGQQTMGALPLVGRLGRIEGVGTKIRLGPAEEGIDAVIGGIGSTLPESFAVAEITVAHGAVRTAVAEAE